MKKRRYLLKNGKVCDVHRDKSARNRGDIVLKSPVIQSIIHSPPSPTDPNGSYTGIPRDRYSKPVQDADDL
ncbi:MAG: hypothetical protein RR253_02705 [Oscillospiraceae bacterium]